MKIGITAPARRLVVLVVVGGALAASALAATELARIGPTSLSLEDFNRRYQENLKFFQYRAPTRRAVLDDIVKRELGILEARKLGLDRDPEVVDRMNTVLYHAFLDRKLGKEFEKIVITDAEAKTYYDKNPDLRTSHIFVGLKPNATKDEEKAALARLQEINDKYVKKGEMTFAEIAQRFSEGVAAPMGGDIDFQSKDKLDPAYFEAASRLRVGQVSGIVRTQFGYHIIKKTAERPWLEADRNAVKRVLFEERRNKIFDREIARLRQQYKVTINESLL